MAKRAKGGASPIQPLPPETHSIGGIPSAPQAIAATHIGGIPSKIGNPHSHTGHRFKKGKIVRHKK